MSEGTPNKRLKVDVTFDKRESNTKNEVKVGAIVTSNLFSKPFWHKIHELEQQLSHELSEIHCFPKSIAAIYNPLVYAADLHSSYLAKFVDGPKKILFIGMNPGPFGMCQTSVPFGHVPSVKNWMKLEGEVGKPDSEIPARPVEGLNCKREEQSGSRWWGLMQKLCNTPEQFFKNCYIYNYCPLAFFDKGGRNITPAEIKGEAREKLQKSCTKSLNDAIELLQPEIIISIGRYAEDRVKELKKQNPLKDSKIQTLCIPHPSPRSLNNTNWPEKAEIWFKDNNILPFLQN